MAVRNIGSDCYVSVHFYTGGTWGAEVLIADPAATIEGNARRVQLRSNTDTIDVSGISDVRRQLLPGRGNAQVVVDKLIATNMLMQRDAGGGIYYWRIGEPVKVKVRYSATGVIWNFVGVLSDISISIDDQAPQIESFTVDCDYYGIAA